MGGNEASREIFCNPGDMLGVILVPPDNVKTAKKVNVGASAAVYADLSARFPGAPVKKA